MRSGRDSAELSARPGFRSPDGHAEDDWFPRQAVRGGIGATWAVGLRAIFLFCDVLLAMKSE
jgi:hypothetical protein